MCTGRSHHNHDHDHEHHHEHSHHDDNYTHVHTEFVENKIPVNDFSDRIISSEKSVLFENDLYSERIKGYLDAKSVFAINLMSSPGAGKTSLLEKTIERIGKDISISVIEGDQQTENDAMRIKALNTPAIQINTGNGCHLESLSVYNALKKLKPEDESILFIENVGNLVCPALFNIGENIKGVIISTTEGVDKPLKYPAMFALSSLFLPRTIRSADLTEWPS